MPTDKNPDRKIDPMGANGAARFIPPTQRNIRRVEDLLDMPPTKAEHDEIVARLGRPLTQAPGERASTGQEQA
jgi:hypothetical protein